MSVDHTPLSVPRSQLVLEIPLEERLLEVVLACALVGRQECMHFSRNSTGSMPASKNVALRNWKTRRSAMEFRNLSQNHY